MKILITTMAVLSILALGFGMILALKLLFMLPLKILSELSGWHDLSKRFPEISGDSEKSFRFCTVRFGAFSYRSCVHILFLDQYVTFKISLPFRSFHPPFSIPNRLFKKQSRFENQFEIIGESKSIVVKESIFNEILDRTTTNH